MPTAAEAEIVAEQPENPAEESTPAEMPDMAAREIEVFYTFTWAPRPNRARNEHPSQGARKDQDKSGKFARTAKPRSKPNKGKPRETQEEPKAKAFSARPERKDRIDPDNPFAAALMGLRIKS